MSDMTNKLIWKDGQHHIELDHTMVFGKGYDFEGLELCAQHAIGTNGNYLIWPKGISSKKYSLYRDSDGAFAFEQYENEMICKEAAEKWNEEII